jgi:hypothetical protein
MPSLQFNYIAKLYRYYKPLVVNVYSRYELCDESDTDLSFLELSDNDHYYFDSSVDSFLSKTVNYLKVNFFPLIWSNLCSIYSLNQYTSAIDVFTQVLTFLEMQMIT